MTVPDTAGTGGGVPPSHHVSPRRLHPLSPLASAGLALMRSWPVVLLAAARASWWIVGVLAVVLLVWRAAVWTRTTYAIDDEGLVVRSGIVWRTIQVVPPQRVQQVEVRRRLRHRATGLAVVRVGLAGGGEASQVELDALSVVEAERMAATLDRWRERRRAPDGAGTSRPAPVTAAGSPAPAPPPGSAPWPAPVPPPSPVLLRVSTGQLMVAGLTSRSLWLAPFAALAALMQFMTDTRFGTEPTDAVRSNLAEVSPAIVLVAVMVLGLVVAAVGTVVSHHGLEVARAGDDVIVRRGLLEQRSVTIPLDRVQSVELAAHVIRRRLDLAALDVRTADLGGAGGSGGSSTSIPIGGRRQLEALVPVLLPDDDLPRTERHPPAAVRRAVIRRALRLVPLAALIGLVGVGPGAVPVGAAAGLAVAVPTGWATGRRLRSGWNPAVVVTERGAIGWRRSVVPVARIQSIGVVANPFQRRLGLATVRLDVAGTVGGVTLRDVAASDVAGITALVGTPIASG